MSGGEPVYLRVPELEGEVGSGGRGGGELEEGEEEEEEEEDAFKVHLIPRSSPTPRKRLGSWEEVEEPSLTRKVSFADTRGLDLLQVKYYQEFSFPESPEPVDLDVAERAGQCPYYIFPAFVPPATPCQLLDRVRRAKVEVESVQPVEGDPLAVGGLVRVHNLAFQKAVHVRATLDGWASHYDHPARHVAGSTDGDTDQFRFRLSFPGPRVPDGARLEFVVRYETPAGVYWANNGGANYSVVCKAGERAAPTPKAFGGAEVEARPLKSCLKTTAKRYGEQDKDANDADEEGHDWIKEANDRASSIHSNDWIVQVPRVQMMAQANPEGPTSAATDRTQSALESHIQRSTFVPIEQAQGAGIQGNPAESASTPESRSYPEPSPDTSEQQEPARVSSLGPREQGGGEGAEARGENKAPGGEEKPAAPWDVKAEGTRSVEGEALRPEVLPATEGECRAGEDSELTAEGRPCQRSSRQEVGAWDTGSELWEANLGQRNQAEQETIGAADWDEAREQQASTPVDVGTPEVSQPEATARLYLAASLHAVGAYHEEAGAEGGCDPVPPHEVASPLTAAPWRIAPSEGPPLTAGAEQEVQPGEAGTTQGRAVGLGASPPGGPTEGAAPQLGVGQPAPGEHRAGTGAEGAAAGARPEGGGGGGQETTGGAELPHAAPLAPLAAGRAAGEERGTCANVKVARAVLENPLTAPVLRDEPDLESLATLKDVLLMASKFMQLLVFLFVAFSDPGSVLWCTLYLISVFLL